MTLDTRDDASRMATGRAIVGVAEAEELCRQIAADPAAHRRINLFGIAGAGKTALLDEIERIYARHGIEVFRDIDELSGITALTESQVLCIDDICALSLNQLTGLVRVLETGVSAVLAGRRRPDLLGGGQHAASIADTDMKKIHGMLFDDAKTIVLKRLNAQAISSRAQARMRLDVSGSLSQVIADETGGILALVDAALDEFHGLESVEPGGIAVATIRARIAEQMDVRLGQLSDDDFMILTVTAAGAILDTRTLTALLNVSSREVDRLLISAYTSGVLRPTVREPWGLLLPLAQDLLLDRVDAERLRGVQDRLLDIELRDGRLREHTARRLADLEFIDRRLVDHVLRQQERGPSSTPDAHGDDADNDTDTPATSKTAATSTVADEPDSRVLDTLARADALLRSGNLDATLIATDEILSVPDGPGFIEAADLAAISHAGSSRLKRSAELYNYLGAERIGDAAAHAVIACAGIGDLAGAQRFARATVTNPHTSTAGSMQLMADGVCQSLRADDTSAMQTLLQAASAMIPTGRGGIFIDSPAAIAALAALSCGELDVAESILLRAKTAQLGGGLAAIRHEVLLAWTAMLRGDLAEAARLAEAAESAAEAAESGAEAITSTGSATEDADSMRAPISSGNALSWKSCPQGRARFFLLGLHLGIARRSNDVQELERIWHSARGEIDCYGIDLFGLLPLRELNAAATHLHDSYRLSRHNDIATQILTALDWPALWSAPLHWSGVECAIIAEEPAAVAPHAQRLRTIAHTSQYAGVLAAVSSVWVEVLNNRVDTDAIRIVAGDLQQIGLAWEVARLASQAAARASDRTAMRKLHEVARAAGKNVSQPARLHAGHGPIAASMSPDLARLSDREREVAAMVVKGSSYREIGQTLFISPKTVEHHVARIRQRIDAADRPEMLDKLRPLVQS